MSDIWNLQLLLPDISENTINQQFTTIQTAIRAFALKWQDRTDYLEQPTILAQAMNEYNELMSTYGTSGNIGYYTHLRHAQDQNDPQIKALMQKVNDFAVKMSNEIQFFEIRIAKIDISKHQNFLSHPTLTPYHHYLQKLFEQQKFILSEAEEKILALKSEVSHGKWTQMTSSFIAKETRELTIDDEIKPRTFEELLKIASYNPSESIRDQAVTLINSIFDKHLEVGENEINAILQNKKINDELRNYSRPDQARHMGDDIDSAVVDAMLTAVSSRFDLSHRFYALKAKLLGKIKLKYNERNLEISQAKGTYDWQQSSALVNKVFQQLDPEFSAISQRLITNGQIDLYPRQGKKGGAFCAGNLISQPTYILLNHTGKLNDVLTIAHEMGHAINNELIKQKQIGLYYDTPVSTAEVASTFMEDFVLQELQKTADPATQKALLMHKLNDDISTIFRQVAAYQFEQDLHSQFRAKGYLTHQDIGQISHSHMSTYMGDAVEYPDYSHNWWLYWSHIRSFFYVYSYASGLLISKSLQAKVKKDPKFISQVKTFLSTGTSDSPKNIFAKMGIDITQPTFWLEGLSEIEETINMI